MRTHVSPAARVALAVSLSLLLAPLLARCSFTPWTSKVTATCRNGVLDPGEQCDDANFNNFDGCTTGCRILSGWSCTGSPSKCYPRCGNSTVSPEFGEQCDDQNTQDGDGCSRVCTIEKGWECIGDPSHCRCKTTAAECGLLRCGNGTLDPGEECDDGTDNGKPSDGCNSNCSVKQGYACTGSVDGTSVCARDVNVVIEEQRKLKDAIRRNAADL